MFKKALPIWIDNLENEMNIQAKFTASFETTQKNAELKIAGATYYKVILNGKLIHYGPAPTAAGYVRVDSVALALEDKNELAIEVAGYNCFSYDCVKHTSFLQAEIVTGDTVLLATGYDFFGIYVEKREQKVLRYSYQRAFSEIWDLRKDDRPAEVKVLDLGFIYLERKADLPEIETENLEKIYDKGSFTKIPTDWQVPDLQGAVRGGAGLVDRFEYDEIPEKPAEEFSGYVYHIEKRETALPCPLQKGEYAVFELKSNTCALMHLTYRASEDCKILIAFDEKLSDGRFEYEKWKTLNVISVKSAGVTDFTNFDLYGFKYFAVFVTEGSLTIEKADVKRILHPIPSPPKLHCTDETIQKIYGAAIESAKCNFLGIFTDCPGRERAGWLCDSYFSAQAAYVLCGNTHVEDDFVENFLIANLPELPDGMLPMCYPADHPNGRYIPQWAMWFIVQFDGYRKRNPRMQTDALKDKVYKLLHYFEKYENEYGLLENLDGWNFIEWSKANRWTAGVNFPTNMLYSRILKIVGNWYADMVLLEKSAHVRKTVLQFSFDGNFFRDQALRDENQKLCCMPHISEVCQYYAFSFMDLQGAEFDKLKETMLSDFAPGSTKWENIEKANAFIGMYLRMELLNLWGYEEKLVEEVKTFFGGMADVTGTLWEHKDMSSSLNHGFTSYLAVLLLAVYNKA